MKNALGDAYRPCKLENLHSCLVAEELTWQMLTALAPVKFLLQQKDLEPHQLKPRHLTSSTSYPHVLDKLSSKLDEITKKVQSGVFRLPLREAPSPRRACQLNSMRRSRTCPRSVPLRDCEEEEDAVRMRRRRRRRRRRPRNSLVLSGSTKTM